MRRKPILIKHFLKGRGMTLYPFIFVNKFGIKTFKHEMMHWKQIQVLGVWRFYYRILKEYLQHGVNTGPMEMECEEYELFPLTDWELEVWNG